VGVSGGREWVVKYYYNIYFAQEVCLKVVCFQEKENNFPRMRKRKFGSEWLKKVIGIFCTENLNFFRKFPWKIGNFFAGSTTFQISNQIDASADFVCKMGSITECNGPLKGQHGIR